MIFETSLCCRGRDSVFWCLTWLIPNRRISEAILHPEKGNGRVMSGQEKMRKRDNIWIQFGPPPSPTSTVQTVEPQFHDASFQVLKVPRNKRSDWVCTVLRFSSYTFAAFRPDSSPDDKRLGLVQMCHWPRTDHNGQKPLGMCPFSLCLLRCPPSKSPSSVPADVHVCVGSPLACQLNIASTVPAQTPPSHEAPICRCVCFFSTESLFQKDYV